MAVNKFKNPDLPFKWKHFESDIILWLVRWYGRYALSYNDLKEIAAERRLLMIDRSTICHRVQEYAPELERRVKAHLKKPVTLGSSIKRILKLRGNGTIFIALLIKQVKPWIGY